MDLSYMPVFINRVGSHIDYAVIECTAVTEGSVILAAAAGASDSFLHMLTPSPLRNLRDASKIPPYLNPTQSGIGGSGDFARNGGPGIFVDASVAKGVAVSPMVPMCTHADHREHDVRVIVTEQVRRIRVGHHLFSRRN